MISKQLLLSPRLEMIRSLVAPCEILCDIGTDHAYLPLVLVKEGIVKKAIAADVAEGPLEIAGRHIREEGLEKQILIRRSDGFSALDQNEVQTVVIAGMGGALMSDILAEAEQMGKLEQCESLILQPQSDWLKVRKRLKAIRFESIKEKMCQDRGKFYLAILAKPVRNASAKIRNEIMAGAMPETAEGKAAPPEASGSKAAPPEASGSKAVSSDASGSKAVPAEAVVEEYGTYLASHRDPVFYRFLQRELGIIDSILEKTKSNPEVSEETKERIRELQEKRQKIRLLLEKALP